jgi:hypothetical protein
MGTLETYEEVIRVRLAFKSSISCYFTLPHFSMRAANKIYIKKLITLAVMSGLISGLVSSIHHWYGAIAYNTPWRVGVSYWIAGLVLVVYLLLFVYWKYAGSIIGKIVIWIFLFSAVVFQAGFIMFECVYSHVLKNILFFGGMSLSILEKLYPSPTYHLPDNLFFELTGVLQLVGFVAVWYAYLVFKNRSLIKGPE